MAQKSYSTSNTPNRRTLFRLYQKEEIDFVKEGKSGIILKPTYQILFIKGYLYKNQQSNIIPEQRKSYSYSILNSFNTLTSIL